MRISGETIFKGVFLFVGAVFLTIGVILLFSWYDFTQNAEKSEAVITSIEKHGRAITVNIEYEADGVIIDGELSQYNSSMREGDVVDIYVSRDDPYETAPAFPTLEAVFTGLGAALLIVLLIVSIAMRKKKITIDKKENL